MERDQFRHLLFCRQKQLSERRKSLFSAFAERHVSCKQNPPAHNDKELGRLEEQQQQARQENRLIHRALQRLETGCYDRCRKCGMIISDDLLNTNPYSVYCQYCA